MNIGDRFKVRVTREIRENGRLLARLHPIHVYKVTPRNVAHVRELADAGVAYRFHENAQPGQLGAMRASIRGQIRT